MSRRVSKKRMLEAIKSSPGGIISAIAGKVGLAWSATRYNIDTDPDLLKAWNDQRELYLDMAENTVMKSISVGDTQDAKWVLSRLGKKRGYGDNQLVNLDIDLNNLTDAQLEQIADGADVITVLSNASKSGIVKTPAG